MTNATRIDWKVPLILLVASAIPLAAGIARLVGLAANPEISTENARFVAAPLSVIVHILSASLFSILLIRPDEVLSCIFDVPILKIADHPLRRLLQHHHVRCRRLA
jgi:hypothetical protein